MATPAFAGGGTQHVLVEGEPKGATVYLDDVETGPKCQPTPCGFDVPVGHYTLIVQKANFAPSVDGIDVPRRPRKPLVFNYKLDPANGAIVINDPAAKGATITVDDEPKGKVDAQGKARIEVDAGGHQVVVKLGKKNLFEDVVTAETGQDTTINISPNASAEPASDDEGAGSGDASDTAAKVDTTAAVTASPPEPHPKQYISGSVVVDVGFRRFSYQNPTKGPLSHEDEDGQVIAGPAVEVWPMEILDVPHLRGLSLFFRAELPVDHQNVIDGMNNMIATTSWSSYEASVQYRWTVGDSAAVEAGAGYVDDVLGFSADIGDKEKLPDADYQSLRLGARASLLLGPVEPYIAAENRVILDGGVLPTRFCPGGSCASGSGVKGAIGIAARHGSFLARAEASDVHYSWTFANSGQTTGNFFMADGATDKILSVSLTLGYLY